MDALELSDDARRARRLGIYGGSFDPPHAGHLHVARAARGAFDLDHVVFVPAARPPHKPGTILAPGEERAAMLEILLADLAWASIWTGELVRSGPSYTVDTVHAIRAEAAEGSELFLLLGSDNLAGLADWHRAEELLGLVQPVVVRRAGSPPDDEALARFSPEARVRLERGLLDVVPVDASASDLRERLRRGEDPGPLLPAGILDHIRERGLYRSMDG